MSKCCFLANYSNLQLFPHVFCSKRTPIIYTNRICILKELYTSGNLRSLLPKDSKTQWAKSESIWGPMSCRWWLELSLDLGVTEGWHWWLDILDLNVKRMKRISKTEKPWELSGYTPLKINMEPKISWNRKLEKETHLPNGFHVNFRGVNNLIIQFVVWMEAYEPRFSTVNRRFGRVARYTLLETNSKSIWK